MWRRRRPEEGLGAPAHPPERSRSVGIPLIVGLFFVTLPLFALSLTAMWLFDRLALPRLPRLAGWLGVGEVAA
jgi:uncharacterized iron-regulated membrane protein